VNYLDSINTDDRDPLLVSMRAQAEKEDIPIIDRESGRLLRQLILFGRVDNILEIGTAIGYNAIRMAKIDKKIHVTTIERDAAMIKVAKRHINSADLADRITLIEDDAVDLDTDTLNGPYGLIFIDAAKAQNITFFEKFEPLLAKGGLIVVDNVLFHGLIDKQKDPSKNDIESKNLKALVEKIDRFNRYVMQRDDYDTAIHAIGDGLCVCVKL